MELEERNTFYIVYDGARIELRKGSELNWLARVDKRLVAVRDTFSDALDAACDYADGRR